ncbi:MAG: sensor histidine kinase [Bacillota bacterium]
MDKISFLPFFLQSFPESLVLLALGLTLLGKRPGVERITFLALITTLFSFLIRLRPIVFGTHTLLQMLFMIVTIRLVTKANWKISVLAPILGGVALGIAESISIPILAKIFGLGISDILGHPWLRVIFPLPHMFIMGLVAILCIKRNWTIVNLEDHSHKEITKAKSSVLFLIIITAIQAFFFITFNLTFYALFAGNFPTISPQLIYTVSALLLLAATVTNVFVFYRLSLASRKEAQLEAEMHYLQGMQDLYLTVRTQRHDFLNHVTALYGMLMMNKFDRAKEYMTSFYTEVKASQSLLSLDIPALSGLLQIKSDTAKQHGIVFHISVDPEFAAIPVPPVELIGIIGNLIDNAFEAVIESTSTDPQIEVELYREEGKYLIEVSNTGTPLDEDYKNKIFNIGFSTKSTDRHSGLGLASVLHIIKKHRGTVEIGEPDDFAGVRFAVMLPGD